MNIYTIVSLKPFMARWTVLFLMCFMYECIVYPGDTLINDFTTTTTNTTTTTTTNYFYFYFYYYYYYYCI